VTPDVVRSGEPLRVWVRLTEAPAAVRPVAILASVVSVATRGLGLELQDLEMELAQRFGYARIGGALVATVLPDSAADRKNVLPGVGA
jgi:S1-C subfamily serine protease